MAPDSVRSETVSRRKFILGAGSVGLAGLAGCSGDGDGTDTSGGTDTDGNGGDDGTDTQMNLTGSLRVSGSSTVFPVAEEVGRKFAAGADARHPDVSWSLSKDGSGGGFRNVFIPGDSDINNASRPIKDEERQDCNDNGIEPIEFLIAQDALTIVVNNDNDWVDSMSVSTIGEIWDPETAPTNWSDVSAAEDDWPDEEFSLWGAATTSGTFDYFTERVVGEEDSIREDYEGTERDNEIAQGVSDNVNAFGYLPFAYYVNNPDSVKAIGIIEDGSDPVQPSLEAAKSGDYPLARPLYFYVNDNKLADKVTLQEFCKFYIKEAGKQYIADDIGYVPSTEEDVQNNLDKLNNQM